ncbi:MAG: flippase [Candidatus Jettenia sp.]|nr:flippase [Candidatus Jettenia sp. AMX1]MBC6927542.1 flippase [Candidatus Jettenia sp.]NUN23924.1 flippase [Candidatus Jettenia caeni]KAA0251520.1 MAG: flippase [Candidatus Jettenia sp. AMX1]MCE7881342.1 flippase [Candidatus Jettenia sp. AMX1]MCQ3926060.1 flippase [Candidatus Jettenia sp.]
MNQTLMKFLPSFVRVRLEGRVNLQNILANTGWLFIDKILRMGVGLFVGVWIARYLGPEQFGLYSYAIAFVSLFGAFATLGLDGIVVRDIVRYPSCKDEILGTAFILKLVGGMLTFLLITGTIFFLHPHDNLIHWLAGIIAFGMIFQSFDTIDFWFQSQVQSKYTVYAKNAAFLLIALLKVVLILIRAPLIAFAFAGLAEIIFSAVGLTIACKLYGYTPKIWWWSFSWGKKLLRDSWPLILAGFSIAIYMKIDQVMLGEMVGHESVGIYSAAIRISEIWYFIPTAIVSSVFPSIIRARSVDEKLYYRRLQKLFSLMTALALTIAILMTFLSKTVIILFFGKSFEASGSILSIHIWASLFVFLGVAQSPWDLAENLTRLSLMRTIVGAIINIVLNFILIPLFSIIGAAIATIISYAFSAYISNLFNGKTRPIFFYQTKSVFFIKYLWVLGGKKYQEHNSHMVK